MGTVLSLADEREARTPHLSGAAQCVGCQHTWMAAAPIGTFQLECPECRLPKGVFVNEMMRGEVRFVCHCGNDLFRIHAEAGPYCAKCAKVAEGWK